MLWASGPRAHTERAIVVGATFLRGEEDLNIDSVTKEETERKDIMAARLARKFQGDFNRTHCSQKRGHSQLTRGTDPKHQRGQRPPSAPQRGPDPPTAWKREASAGSDEESYWRGWTQGSCQGYQHGHAEASSSAAQCSGCWQWWSQPQSQPWSQPRQEPSSSSGAVQQQSEQPSDDSIIDDEELEALQAQIRILERAQADL